MSHKHAIWNHIDGASCIGVDFGSHDGYTQRVLVGTGPNNSHEFAKIEVERRELPDGGVEFLLYVNDKLVERGELRGDQFDRDLRHNDVRAIRDTNGCEIRRQAD